MVSFERHIGLHDGVRLARFKHIAAQLGKPRFLVLGSGASGIELFVVSFSQRLALLPMRA